MKRHKGIRKKEKSERKVRLYRNTAALAKRKQKTNVKVSWLQGYFGLCGAY